MSDFYNPPEHRVARKAHQCTYCAEAINAGEFYVHQTGVYDGRWYTSKMHPECFDELVDIGDGEYTPYSNERPRVEHVPIPSATR
jgi:hypothetical protein